MNSRNDHQSMLGSKYWIALHPIQFLRVHTVATEDENDNQGEDANGCSYSNSDKPLLRIFKSFSYFISGIIVSCGKGIVQTGRR